MVRIPSYRLHKRSGLAVVTLAGRDHYLGPHGSPESKRRYNRMIAEYMASGGSKVFGAPEESITVAEVLLACFQHARVYYGTGSSSEFHRIKPIIKATRLLYGSELAASFSHVQFKSFENHFFIRSR